MSDIVSPPTADEEGYAGQITRYAAALAQVGTPEAIAAIEALAEALAGMARAFELAAVVLRSELPTSH